jgi:dihydrofolate reductase
MGKIIISANVSIDGIGGGERFIERVGRIKGEAAKILLDEALGAEALLLGRRTYEFFAARWPGRGDELADRLNSMPKYVLSSTLEHPAWNNTTVLSGDPATTALTLKQQLDGDLVSYASLQLGHALLENDLVDELRLMIYPTVIGAGEPLFGQTSATKPMRLCGSRTTGDGVVVLTYQRPGG